MRSTSVSFSSTQATSSSLTLSRLPLPSSLRTGRASSASAGRNSEGRITVRHRGGGHKRAHRLLDWSRQTTPGLSFVVGFVYDPRRTARLAQILHRPSSSSETPSYSLFPASQGRQPLQRVKVHSPSSGLTSKYPAPSAQSSTSTASTPLQPGDQAPL